VGGAVVMNAGAHGREMKDVVRKVEALRISSPSGGIDVFEGSALAFGYRKNDFLRPDHLVLAVELEFESADAVVVKEYVRKLLEQRKASQPVDLPSCGSVFKNPVAAGMKAWQVIERLGLRGHGIGGAVFSPKHGNFIVNLGGARAGDVRALIELAQIRCRNELGFELEPEVKLIGFPDRM
jgi:UDP-N-acetylmuramate dehydrogenase